jgi:molybdopterin molybdotransferase
VAAESLTFEEARRRVLAAAVPLPVERAPLHACAGRALREELRADHALPAFANSSMDGFAVRSADLAGASPGRPRELRVAGVIPAGRVADRPAAAGECMRIMTGAMLPQGADAVVPFEDSPATGDPYRASFVSPARPGQNVRAAGADIAAGALLLEPGRELTPWDLGLAAGFGRAQLAVGRRPVAIVISTGDELLEPGEPERPGAIRDSNRPMLTALLEAAGARVLRGQRLGDDPGRVAAALRAALDEAEVVCSIGGVSAGDFDPVKLALGGVGGIALWRVAMKPGRPQAFGAPGGRLFFGLPGNPASVACSFEAFVRPAVRRLQGFAELGRPRLAVRAGARIESRAGRVDLVRAVLERRDDGWWATPAGDQVSGHLLPQARAHALVRVPEEREALEPGDAAEAWVLRWPEGS